MKTATRFFSAAGLCIASTIVQTAAFAQYVGVIPANTHKDVPAIRATAVEAPTKSIETTPSPKEGPAAAHDESLWKGRIRLNVYRPQPSSPEAKQIFDPSVSRITSTGVSTGTAAPGIDYPVPENDRRPVPLFYSMSGPVYSLNRRMIYTAK